MWIIIIGIIVLLLLWQIIVEIRIIRTILTEKIWKDYTNSKAYKKEHSWESVKQLLKGKT